MRAFCVLFKVAHLYVRARTYTCACMCDDWARRGWWIACIRVCVCVSACIECFCALHASIMSSLCANTHSCVSDRQRVNVYSCMRAHPFVPVLGLCVCVSVLICSSVCMSLPVRACRSTHQHYLGNSCFSSMNSIMRRVTWMNICIWMWHTLVVWGAVRSDSCLQKFMRLSLRAYSLFSFGLCVCVWARVHVYNSVCWHVCVYVYNEHPVSITQAGVVPSARPQTSCLHCGSTQRCHRLPRKEQCLIKKL